MASWRDTDPRNLCECGTRKSPEATRCQSCHMRRVHQKRRMRTKINSWVDQAAMGLTLTLAPGDGCDDFAGALREVIENVGL